MTLKFYYSYCMNHVKIKTIDCNWPVRVSRTRDARDSSSDEFSSDSRSDEDRPKRGSKLNSNGRKMSEHVLTSGQTGGTIKSGNHELMNHTLANTPNSTSNRSTAENSPKRKSRPPSNVGTSPRSSIDGRIHRIQSLDERVSSLSGSRNHSDASGNDVSKWHLANIIIQTHHLIMQIFSLMSPWRYTHHTLRLVSIYAW